MTSFSVDSHNAADKYIGCVIVSGGVGQIYTAITHWMNTLAHRDPSIHEKLFAINNELINDYGHVVEVDRAVFNIPTTAVHIPTTAAIIAAITADPNITKMRPY